MIGRSATHTAGCSVQPWRQRCSMLVCIDVIYRRSTRSWSRRYYASWICVTYVGCGMRTNMRRLCSTTLLTEQSILLPELLQSSIGRTRLAKGFCIDAVLIIDLAIFALRSLAGAPDLRTLSVTARSQSRRSHASSLLGSTLHVIVASDRGPYLSMPAVDASLLRTRHPVLTCTCPVRCCHHAPR